MKKILNKVRWNIVEALKGEEKVPEKGFKITTWVGQYGQQVQLTSPYQDEI